MPLQTGPDGRRDLTFEWMRWTPEEDERLLAMRADGVTQADIAVALGRTVQSVAQHVTKMNLPRPRRPVAERFWEKVQRDGVDHCWPWLGALDRKGYGAFKLTDPKRRANASRVAYELANGPIPDGLCVMHTCDNPPCVNPAHLRLGTIAENNLDRVAKGRPAGWAARTA